MRSILKIACFPSWLLYGRRIPSPSAPHSDRPVASSRRVRGSRDSGPAGAVAVRAGAEEDGGGAAAREAHPVHQALHPADVDAGEDADAQEGRQAGGADTPGR